MNRCMQWMMNAMERVKMSRDPRPRIRSALTTSGKIIEIISSSLQSILL